MSAEIKISVPGLFAAAGAGIAFSVIDMTFKFLSGDYPLYEVVLFRSVVAVCVMLAVILPLEGGYHLLRTHQPKLHFARCLAVLFANICFFTGLAILPLAEAVAIAFATPLIVTALSALFLGERPGPWRWGAVAIGFLGVLIIMRPGPGTFQAAALLPALGACGYATLHVLTRRAGSVESGATMAFYPMLGFLIVSALAGILFGNGRFADGGSPALDFILRAWIWPAPEDWPYLIGVGLAGSIGGYLVTQAYRMNEAALAAPFEYIAMPMSVLWGVLIFNEWPGPAVWAGSSLIIAAGLVSVWRETRRNRPVPRPRPRAEG
ncbi:DMT family transporter [Leisingera methylohalidivorans]|uniref:Membrane protein n=1 Tax=Leisingera methylohalidivorans DSM 14336 TaxID=999552 RepID=V9VUF8_9RHOB|nr:DMT family transporter [Leisingera methylohalidivorans]AHD02371.1 membrane protein [Leisingera methylohalidivorans DSM 14336]